MMPARNDFHDRSAPIAQCSADQRA